LHPQGDWSSGQPRPSQARSAQPCRLTHSAPLRRAASTRSSRTSPLTGVGQ
jgi:hypothetical protein